MKLLHIFRLELSHQVRALTTWLYFLVLLASSFLLITMNFAEDARDGYVLVNAPVIIGAVTVLSCVLWLLIGASVAGHAATRDVQTRMHPLTYTAPVSKSEYLGGKFLAAFLMNAIIVIAIPAGILIAIYLNDVEAEIKGPFRASTYLVAYFFLALPNAFFATAVQFSFATLKRSAMASFIAGGLLFFLAYILGSLLNQSTTSIGWGNLIDPMSFSGMLNRYTSQYTPIQINTSVISLEGPLLWNRLVWLGVSLLSLTCLYNRFSFAHPTTTSWWKRRKRIRSLQSTELTGIVETTPITVPAVRQDFGFATQVTQTLNIALVSFRQLAKSYVGILFLVFLALLVVLIVPFQLNFLHVPMIPRTGHLMTYLTASLTDAKSPWIIIPLIIILYAGELVWREREAGLSEITGATPVKEWVLFTGKFLGLTLILLVWLTLLMVSGIITQWRLNYHHIEVGHYLQTLFGIQFIDYLLFALLALTVHVVINQKYLAHLALLITYAYIAFAPTLGIENKLFIYGADTGWSYSDMNGFGRSLIPWFWFKFYWVAWALVLAVVARLLWVRNKGITLSSRLQLVRSRFTGLTRWTTVLSICLIISIGGFIIYNNQVLNKYDSSFEKMERSVAYEKRFLHFEDLPQPVIAATKLQVDIFPKENKTRINGTYHLINESTSRLDSILVSCVKNISTHNIIFNQHVKQIAGNNSYDKVFVFTRALEPGDSVDISFAVDYSHRGFTNSGIESYVNVNGTYFTNSDLLPVIGFQPYRCLDDVSMRKKYRLAPRTAFASLYDSTARNNLYGTHKTNLETIVSTDEDQVAMAPGSLRRTWKSDGRTYFHYVTNAPVPNDYAFFSARYVVQQVKWNDVNIEVFYHPGHIKNLNSILSGARAALNYYTRQFGPYPFDVFRLVEHPGYGSGMHAEATTIDFQEGFTLLNPADTDAYDLPFYVVAHEAAHQWWGGAQLQPARVEGAIALTETMAVYTGMQVLEEKYGDKYLQRYLTEIRKSYEIPRTKAATPLLRATDKYQGYRKAPFALYALTKYISREKVNGALKQVLMKHGSGKPPLPTTLDLYRELKAITPDTLQYLLHDLFEANTFWGLKTDQVTARHTQGGWEVTLDVQARKDVTDEMGNETRIPMNDWIQIGVFGEAGKVLYLQNHRIRTGKQTIHLTLSERPASAGIDPNYLLVDLKMYDNIRDVKVEK